MNSYPRLFEPVEIGPMKLRNRLVMSPMETQFASPEGLPSKRTIAYFEARARGGVGLITTGASCIDPLHKEIPSSHHFGSDDVIDSHRALTDAVHALGAKIQPQIAHAGPDGVAPQIHQIESVGPSAIQSYLTGSTSRALGEDEFQGILDQYRAAARRVRECGYDGIELHAAHGYMLLGSYLTPWRNARSDSYSGRRREGRMRAVVEAIHAIKSEVGSDFPLTLRLSGFERIAGGRESPDTAGMAPAFVEAGVDAFHVTGGVIDRYVSRMVNGSQDPAGLNVAQARAIKNVVDVPVMVVGRIHTPELAEEILAAGDADLIVMGRPMLADAQLPIKAETGRSHEIRRCISCQNCIDAMEIRMAMDCAINPTTGRESEIAVTPAKLRKRVVVIGGGPGGLEAARIAAIRGHHVELYERNDQLGGALIAASTVHPENESFLAWLQDEVGRGTTTVALGREMTADSIAALEPDAVIVATGGRLETPRIDGDRLPHVWTGRALREMYFGRVPAEANRLPGWMRFGARALAPLISRMRPPMARRLSRIALPIGRRVVILGADLAALELAEFLATRGRRVALFDAGDSLAPEIGGKRRAEHMDRLDRTGVSINLGVRIESIRREGVALMMHSSRRERLFPADSVIIAGRVEADTTLFDSLEGRVAERYAVGDCTGLGLIQKAVLDGSRAGAKI
jgi:2,4-dienoyl-CoA reductase-like NADH-dependent reductase (Old Yellow Enzyme family)